MAFSLVGPVDFKGAQDAEGHLEFQVTYKCVTTSNNDGPYAAMNTPGLPQVGDGYSFGVDGSETYVWAWCRPGMDVSPASEYREGDFPKIVHVTRTFSTKKRVASQERPNNSPAVANPLDEPPKVSGSFTSKQVQGVKNRFGNPITNSAFEIPDGPNNQWDAGHDTIVIEQNVPTLYLACVGPASFKHHLNSTSIWGLPLRSVKLTNNSWTKNYGQGTSYYYTRTTTFEIDLKRDTLSRAVFAGRSSGSPILTMGVGLVGSYDVGRPVTGTGIPAGTTITGINHTTGALTMSANATSTGSANVTLGAQPGGMVGNWDRDLLDEGTKALRGHWNTDGTLPRTWVLDGSPSVLNPNDFVTTQDTNGNFSTVLLDGHGLPLEDGEEKVFIHIEYYPEGNFLSLLYPNDF
jgi:hypothetical protein